MRILATKQRGKQHHNLRCTLFEDGNAYYCQYKLQGKSRSAFYTVSFDTIQEASDYLDRTTEKDFQEIISLLISQGKR